MTASLCWKSILLKTKQQINGISCKHKHLQANNMCQWHTCSIFDLNDQALPKDNLVNMYMLLEHFSVNCFLYNEVFYLANKI